MTEGPRHAVELSRSAVENGADLVVAVGGDGTANEVLWGMVDDEGALRRPDVELGLFAGGTGSDFLRHLGRFDVDAQIAALNRSGRRVDYGLARIDTGEDSLVRPFLNEASVGVSAQVVQYANRLPQWFGSGLHYGIASVRTIATHRPQAVSIKIDESMPTAAELMLLVMANGQYFGGGMPIAPHARCNDGQLEFVHVGGVSTAQMMGLLAGVYRRRHVDDPNVVMRRVKSVELIPDAKVPISVELDGEDAGHLPGTFAIVSSELRIRAAGLDQASQV